MANVKITEEFQRLIAFIKDQNDTLKKNGEKKEVNKNNFRIRQLSRVVAILKKYPQKISKKNYNELDKLPGIGKSTVKRIKEILENGKLEELGDFVDEKREKQKSLEELEEIVGVGRSNALDFYEQGITSVKILKQKIKKKEIEVNDKIILGLKYHGVFKTNIPRKEIDEAYKLLKKIVNKMNKKHNYTEENKYCFEICGSYRRQKPFSNDIDVLLTKFGTTERSKKSEKHLIKFVSKLKKNIKKNGNKPLLVDDMTDKNIETKYMGFSKFKDNPVRRIDIRYVPYTNYHSALLYFTGSRELNTKMRQIAKKKGFKLSEYGLFRLSDDKKIIIKSERYFFKKLDMEYLHPRLR
jgi:DNA polymerase/3'-5' exonuclease PolX